MSKVTTVVAREKSTVEVVTEHTITTEGAVPTDGDDLVAWAFEQVAAHYAGRGNKGVQVTSAEYPPDPVDDTEWEASVRD